MGESLPREVQDALDAALELVTCAKTFFDAGDWFGHTCLMQPDWLRQVDRLPAICQQAKVRIEPLLSGFAETSPHPRPIERAGFVTDSVFELAIKFGESAVMCRGHSDMHTTSQQSDPSKVTDDDRRTFAEFVSKNWRRPSPQDWDWVTIALKNEAKAAAKRKLAESASVAAETPATEQRGTKKRRRRKSIRQQRKLTDQQLEAVKHHADYQGNVAEVGRQMGIGTSAARQHVRAAYKNLNKPVPKKPKTTSHKRDQRGQTDVAKSDDKRG